MSRYVVVQDGHGVNHVGSIGFPGDAGAQYLAVRALEYAVVYGLGPKGPLPPGPLRLGTSRYPAEAKAGDTFHVEWICSVTFEGRT